MPAAACCTFRAISPVAAPCLGALLAAGENDHAARAKIVSDLAEHVETFRSRFAEIDGLDLPKEVHEGLASVEVPLAAYISDAERTVGLAFSDRAAALAQLPEFLARFEQLEDAMAKVSDGIEAARAEAEQSGSATASLFQVLLAIVGAVGVLISFLVLFVTRASSYGRSPR